MRISLYKGFVVYQTDINQHNNKDTQNKQKNGNVKTLGRSINCYSSFFLVRESLLGRLMVSPDSIFRAMLLYINGTKIRIEIYAFNNKNFAHFRKKRIGGDGNDVLAPFSSGRGAPRFEKMRTLMKKCLCFSPLLIGERRASSI